MFVKLLNMLREKKIELNGNLVLEYVNCCVKMKVWMRRRGSEVILFELVSEIVVFLFYKEDFMC